MITRCAEVNSFLFISIFPFSNRGEPVPFVKNTLSDGYVGIILGMGRGEKIPNDGWKHICLSLGETDDLGCSSPGDA